MADRIYGAFSKQIQKALKDKNIADVASTAGVSTKLLNDSIAGTDLPSIEEIFRIAKAAGVKPGKLTDAALDDLAAEGDKTPQAPKRPAVRTSPMKPTNIW